MAGTIILKEKQAKILLSLKNTQQPWRIGSLSVACGTTYVHTHNFIKMCTESGLTSIEKHGKIKEIKLTEKGAQVAEMISGIYAIISPQAAAARTKGSGGKERREERGKEISYLHYFYRDSLLDRVEHVPVVAVVRHDCQVDGVFARIGVQPAVNIESEFAFFVRRQLTNTYLALL